MTSHHDSKQTNDPHLTNGHEKGITASLKAHLFTLNLRTWIQNTIKTVILFYFCPSHHVKTDIFGQGIKVSGPGRVPVIKVVLGEPELKMQGLGGSSMIRNKFHSSLRGAGTATNIYP